LVGDIVAGIGVLEMGLGYVGFFRRRRCSGEADDMDFDMAYYFEKGAGPRRFTHRELNNASNNLAEEGKLGEGGFGGVYIGLLMDPNREITVKRVSRGSKPGKKEYLSEVKIICRLRHRNLVQRLVWCHDNGSAVDGRLEDLVDFTYEERDWPFKKLTWDTGSGRSSGFSSMPSSLMLAKITPTAPSLLAS